MERRCMEGVRQRFQGLPGHKGAHACMRSSPMPAQISCWLTVQLGLALADPGLGLRVGWVQALHVLERCLGPLVLVQVEQRDPGAAGEEEHAKF